MKILKVLLVMVLNIIASGTTYYLIKDYFFETGIFLLQVKGVLAQLAYSDVLLGKPPNQTRFVHVGNTSFTFTWILKHVLLVRGQKTNSALFDCSIYARTAH